MRHRVWRRQADARLDEFAMSDDSVTQHPQAILADDELIDSVVLGRRRRAAVWAGGWDPDDRLAAMLSAWRADAGAEPVRRLVSVDAAQAAIGHGRSQRRLRPLALVAALLVVVGTGLTIGAGTAQPGDPLWGLSRVVDSDRAESVTIALKVQSQLSTVRTALAQGRTDFAAATLAEVKADLPAVRPEEGRDALAAEQRDLSTQVERTHPAGPATPTNPSTGNPRQTDNPPPDFRAEQRPAAGPPAESVSPNRAAPPANQASPEPSPAQQLSNPPPDNPPPANSPPGDPPRGGGSPAQGASAPAQPPQQQETEQAPPAHQPLLQIQLGNRRGGML